jgi:asparagine N-glycosylation enzyme membrane subunit Stt3
MPIQSYLTYKEPRSMIWLMVVVMVIAATVFYVLPPIADVLGALSVLQSGESYRIHVERKFWKREAERLMGGEVARMLAEANKDLLRFGDRKPPVAIVR